MSEFCDFKYIFVVESGFLFYYILVLFMWSFSLIIVDILWELYVINIWIKGRTYDAVNNVSNAKLGNANYVVCYFKQ